MRRMICERWLKPTDDRAALAKVILAVYDGIEVVAVRWNYVGC